MPKTVTLQFSPTYCTLAEDPEVEVEELLYTKLAYHPAGYFFSPKFQARIWDGFTRLYYPNVKRFRIGLLSRVENLLAEQGYEVVVRGRPEAREFIQRATTYQLREYQRQAATVICQKRFGILQAPMRSGKTMMFIAVVDSERQFPVIFFCRSLDLAYQTRDRLRQFLPDVYVGLVGDGQTDIGDVTIITIQSAFAAYSKACPEKNLSPERGFVLQQRLDVARLIQKAKLVFYDEVHHIGAITSRFILDKCIGTTMKIGLSATPFSGKDEDMLVEQSAGPVIHSVSYSDLIREGFLLRPYIYMYKLPKMALDDSYPTVYKYAVVNNQYLTGLIVRLVQELNHMGKSVVVQTELLNHTAKLGKAIGCPTLTGKDTTDYRQEMIKNLNSKQILCLVSTLFEEGLDVPTLDYTINAAGGLSNIATLQRMRSITASTGKDSCGIIDFQHQCKYLDNHSKIRKRLYKSEPEFVFELRDISDLTLEELQ